MTTRKQSLRGFSLIELMVGIALGMVGILIVMQVFSLAEEQRRSTTSGADAQINGLVGGYQLERDIRMAGLGMTGLGCTTIKAYNSTQSPPEFTLPTMPIVISTVTGSSNSQVRILYSTSGYGSIPATIQDPMPNSSANLRVNNGIGFVEGDLVVVSQPPKDCAMVQLSQDAQNLGMANTTGPGTQWNLQHNPGQFVYNPPGGFNIFPTGGYTTGARVNNLGTLTDRLYYVENNSLMMRDMMKAASATNPLTLAAGIIGLRAHYGRDTDNDGDVDNWDTTTPTDAKQILAVRYAIVARSGNYEKDRVTNVDTLTLWTDGTTTGPTIALRPDTESDINNRDKHYRYKIYQTTIPLRNVIWGKT